MTMGSSDTEFAPAERASDEHILRDADLLGSNGPGEDIIHMIPHVLMVLNRQRQVVFKNQALMDLLGVSSDQDILGKRPGELLRCIHAQRNAAGCGTTEFCRECGAVNAILKSRREKVRVEEECRITSVSGDAYEFRVWASPFSKDGRAFTLFTVSDISNEKRREALERTFFHDLNNLLTVITGKAALVAMAKRKEDILDFVQTIQQATKELGREITSHRKLVQAEKGGLSLELTSGLSSLELVDEVVQMFSRIQKYSPVIKKERCSDFVLTTDRTLLLRVLYNMVKNAIEATSASGAVSLRCEKEDSSGVFSVRNPVFMPRSTQHQVFQRSFSTKGKGRGIGTYSMKLFGEKYLRGRVWFSTSRDEGTTFFISVPLSFESA
jgi:signal transduction histidine kinase